MTYWISCTFSCIVHLAILLLLAFLTFVDSVSEGRQFVMTFENVDTTLRTEETNFEITSGAQSSASGMLSSELEEVAEVTLQAPVALTSVEATKINVEPTLDLVLPTQPADDIQSFLTKLASTTAATVTAKSSKGFGKSQSQTTDELSDSEEETGDGQGLGEGDFDGLGSGSSGDNFHESSFFGTNVEGKKFVFVVDSSRSMTGARWRVATYELMRTLHNMTSGTEFFIYCFDETDHPIFSTGKSHQFHFNDPTTLEKSQKWIESLVLGRGTFPGTALAKAVKMEPDAIYLLSDGVIQDNSIWLLRQINRDKKTGEPKVPIHTILLLSPMGQMPLETIASENGGTFKNITVDDILR